MLYKTIVFELLQDRADLHEHLRRTRLLLRTLDLLATELRDRHLSWKEALAPSRPGSTPEQLASEAMELAIQDLIFPQVPQA